VPLNWLNMWCAIYTSIKVLWKQELEKFATEFLAGKQREETSLHAGETLCSLDKLTWGLWEEVEVEVPVRGRQRTVCGMWSSGPTGSSGSHPSYHPSRVVGPTPPSSFLKALYYFHNNRFSLFYPSFAVKRV
jgi:hypothetical protein